MATDERASILDDHPLCKLQRACWNPIGDRANRGSTGELWSSVSQATVRSCYNVLVGVTVIFEIYTIGMASAQFDLCSRISHGIPDLLQMMTQIAAELPQAATRELKPRLQKL